MDALFTLASVLVGNARGAFADVFLEPAFRLYWGWLLAAVILGVFVWLRDESRGGNRSLSGLLGFLFPRAIYGHQSTYIDYGIYLINAVLFRWTLGIAPFVATTIALATALRLDRWFGSSSDMFAWHTGSIASFTIVSVLAMDLATFIVHAAHHRIPVLWEFHKVHHTAEVLTPVTVYRKHPLYDVFAGGARGVLAGFAQGVAAHAFIGRPEFVTLFGINVVYVLFHAAGSNLRHSHIWLSFGPWLSRIFISPAQHQIHHSTAEKHWNKNFGEVLALWDWLFGSLYIPAQRETLEYGVMGAERQEHPTIWDAYLVPFVNAGALVKRGLRGGEKNEN